MQKQWEEIEQQLMSIFVEFKKVCPDLHRLTFELDKYKNMPNVKLHGYYHDGKNCESYDYIGEIHDLWHKHEILFQKFDHVL